MESGVKDEGADEGADEGVEKVERDDTSP